MAKRLYRSESDRVLGGVCAGLGSSSFTFRMTPVSPERLARYVVVALNNHEGLTPQLPSCLRLLKLQLCVTVEVVLGPLLDL